jgi:putative spermidine/putrescine transport system permease protein
VGIFVMAPHTVPGIVLGVAILFAGASAGFQASTTLLVISLACYLLAVVTRLTMAQLAGLDPALERASFNLGASRLRTFTRITLPQLLPAIFAGVAFTFIEAFDNVSVSMFTHSYRERPLPVELLSIVETDNSPLVAAISGVEILLACVILVVGALVLGLERFSGSQR